MISRPRQRPSVLLDTCVLIPTLLVDTLLRCAEMGFYRVRLSYKILDEFERNFAKQLPKLAEATEMSPEVAAQKAINKRRAIENAFMWDDVLITDFEELEGRMTNHWKDRHVTAAAYKARIQIIVTTNLKHFKAKDLAPFGMQAKHPDIFLSELLQQYPRPMIKLLRQQSESYKKRKIPFDQMLEYLEASTPKFVYQVRQMLTYAGGTELRPLKPYLLQR
jgi:hypothetical protein